MVRSVYVESLDALVRKHNLPLTAWSDGKPRYRYREADFSGRGKLRCSKPVPVELHSRPSHKRRKYIYVPQEGLPMTVLMQTRCRSCDNCLKARSATWRLRAMSEYKAAEAVGARTWFVTLTIEPARRQQILDRARWELARQGFDFDALLPKEQFAEKHRQFSKEITRYIKRVRKNSGALLRFVCVTEAHADGEPHYHLLIHECDVSAPLRKRILEDAWQYGFSKNKLARDARAAYYVTKYLTKSSLARVRASLDYGQGSNPHASSDIATA